MRMLLPVLSVLILLCSCSKYQYLKVSSNDTRQNTINEFVTENDSFRVVYKFNGIQGPVQIAVVNKTMLPLQVDWNKSFFIKNGKSTSLFTPPLRRKYRKKSEMRMITHNVAYSQKEKIIRGQSIEPVQFKGSINKVSLPLFPKGFLKGGHKEREMVDMGGESKMVKRSVFSEENSPLGFRLQLALSVEGNPAPPVILDNSFYVSESIQARTAPKNVPEQADKILIHKPTITGAILYTTGVIVGTVAVLWLKTKLDW